MANVVKLSVTLTDKMAAMIGAAVNSGEYASTSEVIGEAHREWKLRRSLVEQEHEHIHKLWDEGVASGSGQFKDIEAIKSEARRRLKAKHP